MTCRYCKWLDVPPDKGGRRVPRKDKAYRCTVLIEQPALPLSVTRRTDFRWPPERYYMSPEDGEGCPMNAANDK